MSSIIIDNEMKEWIYLYKKNILYINFNQN